MTVKYPRWIDRQLMWLVTMVSAIDLQETTARCSSVSCTNIVIIGERENGNFLIKQHQEMRTHQEIIIRYDHIWLEMVGNQEIIHQHQTNIVSYQHQIKTTGYQSKTTIQSVNHSNTLPWNLPRRIVPAIFKCSQVTVVSAIIRYYHSN